MVEKKKNGANSTVDYGCKLAHTTVCSLQLTTTYASSMCILFVRIVGVKIKVSYSTSVAKQARAAFLLGPTVWKVADRRECGVRKKCELAGLLNHTNAHRYLRMRKPFWNKKSTYELTSHSHVIVNVICWSQDLSIDQLRNEDMWHARTPFPTIPGLNFTWTFGGLVERAASWPLRCNTQSIFCILAVVHRIMTHPDFSIHTVHIKSDGIFLWTFCMDLLILYAEICETFFGQSVLWCSLSFLHPIEWWKRVIDCSQVVPEWVIYFF